jgi:ABC-type molybdenum transport system ATPase subunit/photorepair protein PhrA
LSIYPEYGSYYQSLIFSSKELEEKLARREEAAEVAMTMQSQISKYYEIECENSKLKEENSYLKYVELCICNHFKG